jgi:Ser/Thr protein kinase RdoA (MazF antagonist)
MPESEVVLLDDNATEVMSYWDLRPESWQVVGFVTSGLEGTSRPIMRIAGRRYLLRRQPSELTENDALFRHSFMRHLGVRGLPVPDLLPRPDGHTYAVVEDGIYELQQWLDGQPFVSDGPGSDARLEAAARTLGRLHQASSEFQWQPHTWPEDRTDEAIAQAYVGLIAERSQSERLPESVRNGLARIAEQAAERLHPAVEALLATPRPPELHIHGDYQAHNLAFEPDVVSSIYDFDAARWDRRIGELAYSLLYFAGVRWDAHPSVTPPLVDDGMDAPSARRFLAAYGDEAPPAEGEARLLGDALALAFPVVFANGIAEDLIFPEDYEAPADEGDALVRLDWADAFWLWLDRYRDTLAESWEGV